MLKSDNEYSLPSNPLPLLGLLLATNPCPHNNLQLTDKTCPKIPKCNKDGAKKQLCAEEDVHSYGGLVVFFICSQFFVVDQADFGHK